MGDSSRIGSSIKYSNGLDNRLNIASCISSARLMVNKGGILEVRVQYVPLLRMYHRARLIYYTHNVDVELFARIVLHLRLPLFTSVPTVNALALGAYKMFVYTDYSTE